MPSRRGSARITGEHFTHRYLWHAALELRARGEENGDGSAIPTMAAALFVFLAIEGFANDLGSRVAPAEWQDERQYFSRGRFQGTLGKLRFLGARLDVTIETSRRPYQTVKELSSRRDHLVHARTESLDRLIRFRPTTELDRVDLAVYKFGDPRFVARAFQDSEILCDRLQAAAQARHGEHIILSSRAFTGMIYHRGGSILEMPQRGAV